MEITRLLHTHKNHVKFVPATDSSLNIDDYIHSTKKKNVVQPEAGFDASSIYQEILSTVHDNRTSKPEPTQARAPVPAPKPKREPQKEKKTEPLSPRRTRQLESQLLRGAQTGEVWLIEDALQRGISVNTKDQYGWSALMCAAFSGGHEAVKYLLSKGADPAASDSKGMDAIALAKKGGHKQTARIIRQFIEESRVKKETESRLQKEVHLDSTQEDAQKFFCEQCKMHFTAGSADDVKHETSIVHLMGCPIHNTASSYLLGPSHKGHQLLRRAGWQGEGLGPEEQGKKLPVKTVLKRDRLGIGVKGPQTVARVTHFAPNDVKAIQNKNAPPAQRPVRKKDILRREKKNKMKEAIIRAKLDF
eukprot:Colp12_sorted_trinity150504_noHs@5478